MVSEIKGPGAPAPQAVDTTVRKAQPTSAASTPHAISDKVTLTDIATRLQHLTESVRDLPVVDQNRVAEFRDALESGAYQMDEQEIADKLANFEKQLGNGG